MPSSCPTCAADDGRTVSSVARTGDRRLPMSAFFSRLMGDKRATAVALSAPS